MIDWRYFLVSVLALLAIQSSGSKADLLDSAAGKALFKRNWIPAPSSTDASDGLGPLFNARSCATCHKAGGGARVVTEAAGSLRLQGAVVRLGDKDGNPDPYYGLQLQTDAVPGLMPEASVSFMPKLAVRLNGPPLAQGISTGVRLAPSLFGASELENIPDAAIVANADPDDRDGDGVSGRPNVTTDGIGRYGWKAAHVTLKSQIAHAFATDIGLSSPLQPYPYGDCTAAEAACRSAASGESPLTDNREVSSVMIALVASYLEDLKRPASKLQSEGAKLFGKSGCAACHVPTYKAANGAEVNAFTDLLLHNMGPELDDGVAEPGVASSEWRTAPLRNRGRGTSSSLYLHDGSATTVEAAVKKHGGEGAHSRETFRQLSASDKKQLSDYVNGQ